MAVGSSPHINPHDLCGQVKEAFLDINGYLLGFDWSDPKTFAHGVWGQDSTHARPRLAGWIEG